MIISRLPWGGEAWRLSETGIRSASRGKEKQSERERDVGLEALHSSFDDD